MSKQKSNTGDISSLSQLTNITDAFTGGDFTKITSEEFANNPAAGKIMAMLYAVKGKELKAANDKILELTGRIGFYQTLPIANIGYVLMNLIGTIVVGVGVSVDMNLWLIFSGALLVLGGNGLPLLYLRKKRNN